MIKGMTGFGSVSLAKGNLKGTLEVKSVNHRYLDISYYFPIGFASVENKIRGIVQEYVERGRLTISFRIISKPLVIFEFNKEAVKAHLKYAQILKKEFGLDDDLRLSDLIKLPGVLDTREAVFSAEALGSSLEASLRKALAHLNSMRGREGKSLARDFLKRLGEMRVQIKKIESRSIRILHEKEKSLTSEEFSSFQKNSDISEETVRLAHYIDEFKRLLKTDQAAGKKMDFVAQEMQRETNTIGSKLQDKQVVDCVIALKSKIEKIREQSQNIE